MIRAARIGIAVHVVVTIMDQGVASCLIVDIKRNQHLKVSSNIFSIVYQLMSSTFTHIRLIWGYQNVTGAGKRRCSSGLRKPVSSSRLKCRSHGVARICWLRKDLSILR